MSSTPDRRAVAWLLALAAAGVAVRLLTNSPGPPGAVVYQAPGPREALDSVSARSRRLAAPLGKGERIDLDRATAEELTRLPRIGPGLAARIVADREKNGPFGSLSGLDRVPGIGPRLLASVEPHATFSPNPYPPDPPSYPPHLPSYPSYPPYPPIRSIRSSTSVSLSTASAAQLSQLPGIGPVKAAAIIAYREQHGRFQNVDHLERVPGFGPALVRRLASLVAP